MTVAYPNGACKLHTQYYDFTELIVYALQGRLGIYISMQPCMLSVFNISLKINSLGISVCSHVVRLQYFFKKLISIFLICSGGV
jgi:hypothetical protein